jgi:hypothetical protein
LHLISAGKLVINLNSSLWLTKIVSVGVVMSKAKLNMLRCLTGLIAIYLENVWQI